MTLSIKPIRLSGPWTEGWALDQHTISSVYLGDNEFGHAQYENKRSEVGERLYQFKYRGNRSGLRALAETAAAFIRAKNMFVEIVVSVPPSNENRRHQPLPAISQEIAHILKLPYQTDALAKVSSTKELKQVFDLVQRRRLLTGVFHADRQYVQGRGMLLLDDLYRSGATLSTATAELLENGRAKSVTAITLTKTRSSR